MEIRIVVTTPSVASRKTIAVNHIMPADLIEKAETAQGEGHRAMWTDGCLTAVWWVSGENLNEIIQGCMQKKEEEPC